MPREYSAFGINNVEEFIANNLPSFIQSGKNVYAGYKYIFIRYSDKDFDVYSVLDTNEDDKHIVFQSLNLSARGKSAPLWTLKPNLIMNRDIMDWTSCFCSANGLEDTLPVCIINPDMLPRINSGETIKARVIAFGIDITTFATEEELEETFPVWDGHEAIPESKGKRLGIAAGIIMPLQFLSRHQVPKGGGNGERIDYDYSDDYGYMRGEILKCEPLDCGDRGDISCSVITVNTIFGDLDIIVENDGTDYTPGRHMMGNILVSADPCVEEYENGAIFDEEHLLKLLQDALENTDFSRIERVLADDCRLLSQDSEEKLVCKKGIIEHLVKISKNRKNKNNDDGHEYVFKNDKDGLRLFEYENEKCIAAFGIVVQDKKVTGIHINNLQ